MGARASPIADRNLIESDHESKDRGPLGILTGLGAGSERGRRTNELGGSGTENRGGFCHRNREYGGNQNRRGRNGL